MPKFSWRKFFAELGRAVLPVVVTQVLPIVTERLQSEENSGSTADITRSDPGKYGRRSTDTQDIFVKK